jgi:hypothetical protein
MSVPTRGRPKAGMFTRAASAATAVAEEEPANGAEERPLRPSLREDDPRARAAKRAAELRSHLGELDDGTDDFYVDPDSIPDGWTYEWKRHSIYGQEDPAYQVQIARDGWSAVPASRHPEMMPYNTTEETILRKGLILMECPTEIVQERKLIELKKARDQVRHKEQQIAGTPEGTMTRDHARVKPSIKKSFEAMAIPEE